MTIRKPAQNAILLLIHPFLACLAVLGAGSIPLHAGEVSSPAEGRFGPVDISGANLTFANTGKEWIATARDVEIRWTGAVLHADRAVVWISSVEEAKAEGNGKVRRVAPPEGSLAVTVYAEGQVRVEWKKKFWNRVQQGLQRLKEGIESGAGAPEAAEELLKGGREAPEEGAGTLGSDRITCDRFLYDFRARKGIMIRARADLSNAFGKTPVPPGTKLTARAEEIRIALSEDGSGRVRLKDASVTDCEFFVPHYDLRASEVKIDIGPGTDPDVWVSFRNLRPRVFGVPLFYFPWMRWNARWRPMIRLRPGHSAEFGWFLRFSAGMEVKTPKPGAPKKETRLGTFRLLWDYFEKRGVAAGLEGRWGLPGDHPFRGEASMYAVHDRGDRRPIARERGFYPLEKHDRWRAFFFHRQEIPSLGARADLEINAYGDPNFLLEFFEEEWKTEKPPESYLQLFKGWENHGGTLLVRPRINDFLTRVEYLPRLRYRGVAHPLPLGLGVVNLFLEGSHVRTRPDNRNATLHSDRFWRFDMGAELAAPVRLLVVEVEPFALARHSAFGKTAVGDGALDRFVLEAGVRSSVSAWRDFLLEAPALAIHDVRHVVTLQADYVNRFHVTRSSMDLITVDEMERVDEAQRIDLRLLNRFETWRKGPGGEERSAELASLEVEVAVFPDPVRDNGGDRFGLLSFDLRLSPFPGFRFESFSVVDPNRWAFDRWDAGITLSPWERFSLSASTSNVPGRLHATSFTAKIRFNEKWSASFREMYDFENGREVFAEFKVRRILHRWVLEVGFHLDRSREDVGVSVSFLPLMAVPAAWP